MKMKNIPILILGVGLGIFSAQLLEMSSADELKERCGKKTNDKEWIGDWTPSNRKVKVYVDGQHELTIYPRQWRRDRRGNVYIREDKIQRWIGEED